MIKINLEDKIEDLERIFKKYKYSVESLPIEKILKESKYIKTEKEFYEIYEALKEKEEEEEWQNYNKNLI